MSRYIIEFIGTFFLVLTIGFTANPIAIGMILTGIIYMGKDISGAHYNPATSLAVFLRKKMSLAEMFKYMGFQVLGSLAAAFCYYILTTKTFAPIPNTTINPVKPLIFEVLFTFILMLVILTVATSKKTAGNSYYGLAIGFTVLGAIYAGGSISGAALNPAVAIGPIIIDTIFWGWEGYIDHLWLYIVGPLAGAVLAAVVYKITNPDEFGT